jgi:hypothetical protein
LKNENTNLKSQLVELQKIVVKEKTLLQTIEELKNELSKTTKEHQEIVDKLEVQVNDFRERNANLMEHINELLEKAKYRLKQEREAMDTETKKKISIKRKEQLTLNIEMLEDYINQLESLYEDLKNNENVKDVEDKIENINILAQRIYHNR